MTPRVLHVCAAYFPATAYGGPVETTHQLLIAVAASGCEIAVATTDANGERRLSSRAEDYGGVGVRYHRALPLNGYGISPGLWISVAARARAYDIIHAHGTSLPSTTVAAWAAKTARKPLVVSPHGSLMRWARGSKAFRKRAYRTLDAMPFRRAWFHVTSESERRETVELGYRAFVVANAVDSDFYSRDDHSDVRERIGIRRDVPIVAWVGRFDPVKNLEPLIEATEDLGVAVVLAGDDRTPYAERLKAIVKERRRTDVAFVGYADAALKRAILQSADVYVHPSLMESYGMSIAEALAAGCPVVASNNTPWQELDAAGAGRWVSTSPAALREAILGVLTAEDRGRLRRNAVLLARGHSWQQRGRQMVAAYRTILSSG